MDIILKIITSLPCLKKQQTHDDKFNCFENRISRLEREVNDIYNKEDIDDKIYNLKETNNLKIKGLDEKNTIKLLNIHDNHNIKLEYIIDKQKELKDVQNEIFYKIQNNTDNLSKISGYIGKQIISSNPRYKPWR